MKGEQFHYACYKLTSKDFNGGDIAMIYTSYYGNTRLKEYMEGDLELVAVSNSIPSEYLGIKVYKSLIPSEDLLRAYTNRQIGIRTYCNAYLDQLDKLDPGDLYDDLLQTILVTLESPNRFCHRHLIALWFKKFYVDIQELPYE